MANVTIKTIFGERQYPSKDDYVAACQRVARKRMTDAQREGYGLRDTSVLAEAWVARQAHEHYDMATVRGENLRDPQSY